MLRGIRGNRVIIGAYVDKRGGVCPMLAAHRNGGRTNFGTFARAWDAFTGANQRKPRRASRREVRTLEGYLEIALTRDGAAPTGDGAPERPLAEEVNEVKATRRRLAEAEAQETAADTLGDVLARTYAEAEQRRSETRTLEVLAEHELDSADAWSAALERADADRP
jgi:hypothetical protein